jgi:hypothetical protein
MKTILRRLRAAINRHPFSASSVDAFLADGRGTVDDPCIYLYDVELAEPIGSTMTPEERDAIEDDLLALARAAGVYVDPAGDLALIEAYANGEVA